MSESTSSSTSPPAGDASSASKKPRSELLKGIDVMDDDEFEEFESTLSANDGAADASSATTENVNVWEDNWDDDTAETDFSKQLKEELAKHGHTASTN